MWKTAVQSDRRHENIRRRMRFACWINKSTDTQRIRNNYCFSTARGVSEGASMSPLHHISCLIINIISWLHTSNKGWWSSGYDIKKITTAYSEFPYVSDCGCARNNGACTRHKQAALCDLCTTACCSVEGSRGSVQSCYLSNNPYT
jgi:hypothetical protein